MSPWTSESCLRSALAGHSLILGASCETTIIGAFQQTGRNWYDISEKCSQGRYVRATEYPMANASSCSSDSLQTALTEYLNRNSTLKTLGIDRKWQGPWSVSSQPVYIAMGGIASSLSMDLHHQTYLYVAGLLERDVRVLVYAGKGESGQSPDIWPY